MRARFVALFLVLVGNSFARGEIVISEIMYNPSGTDSQTDPFFNREWVELYNSGPGIVSLAGWVLEDTQDSTPAGPLPSGAVLRPGQSLVVTGDAATFDATWGAGLRRFEVTNFPNLANSPSPTNETVGIRNAQGQLVDLVNYDDLAPWPPSTIGGFSIFAAPQGLSTSANDSGSNWLSTSEGLYGGRYADGERGSPGFVAGIAQTPFAPSSDASWSMVIIPDTQNYAKSSVDFPVLQQMTQWIADNHQQFRIEVVVQEGDIVNNNNTPNPTSGDQTGTEQWQNVQQAFSTLNEVVPYVMATGNHDYGTTNSQNRSTQFNDFFQASDNSLTNPATGGILNSTMTPGSLENATYRFTAPDGRDMSILSLEWGPRNAAVNWAQLQYLRTELRGTTAMLVTHAYMFNDDTRYDWDRNLDSDPTNDQGGNPYSYPTAGDTNDGQDLWEKLVNVAPAIEMVVSGHVGGDGVGYQMSQNNMGRNVHEMLFNTQFEPNGGNGWFRVFEFLDDGRTVRVRTYSPSLGLEKTDATNLFEFEISPILGGDFNRDGRVDAADYTLWRDSLGASGIVPYTLGDGNGNGVVDAADYQVWRSEFGKSLANAAAISVGAVPEPSSLIVLAAVLSLLAGRTRRGLR